MKSRSGDLLKRLLSGDEMDAREVREHLGYTDADFQQLLSGERVMSVAHQLCFATLLIERVPRLAQRGRALRDQALAAMAYAGGATEVHRSRPPKWSDLKAGAGWR
jgi:hypothetical protein